MLKERRLKLYLRQSDVAEAAGVKAPYISMVEGGDEGVTLRTLRRLAAALKAELRFRLVPLDGTAMSGEDEVMRMYAAAPEATRVVVRRILRGSSKLDEHEVRTIHELLGVWGVERDRSPNR